MPEYVTKEIVQAGQPEVARKKINDLIRRISFERIAKGKCVQVMHFDPYSAESETINSLMNFMAQNGQCINGLHHEIYLSDPGKTEPSKMKTLIRYPVIRA